MATAIGIRYPGLAGRVATYGSIFGPFQDACKPEMPATQRSLTPESRGIQFQRENYQKVAADPSYWPTIWAKAFGVKWNGFSREELQSIQAPFLMAVGDHDFVRLDHLVEAFRLIPNAELAVIPDAGHFVLNAEPQKATPAIETFLDAPAGRIPFATTGTGYHPGETR